MNFVNLMTSFFVKNSLVSNDWNGLKVSTKIFSLIFSTHSINMSQGEIQEVPYLENNTPHWTYSQLDCRKFLTRRSLGGAIVAAFCANNVNYFVAAKESHETSSTRYHYRVALLLIKPVHWKTTNSCTFENYGATVNFATSSDMYVVAYRYVTKSDKMSFIGNVLKKHPENSYHQIQLCYFSKCNFL